MLYSSNSVSMKLNRIGSIRTSAIVLSIEKPIIKKGEVVGTFTFELSPEEILEYVAPSSHLGDIVVTNSFYTSLLQSRSIYIDRYSKLKPEFRKGSGRVESDGKRYYMTSKASEETGLLVNIFIESGNFSRMLMNTYVIAAGVLLLAFVAISLTGNRIVKLQAGSIDRLLQRLEKMRIENSYTELEPLDSEFKSLEISYNELIKNIKELIDAKEQEALLRQQAEIKELGSYFNAHFIFNTLEIIRCFIKEDTEAANKVIFDFSNLLRYSIDATKELVPLSRDIQYIESYLAMNQLRMSDDFSYSIKISQQARQLKIPKLSIQPIVENSLQHSSGKRILMIDVSATVEQNTLFVRVRDNGKGISEKKLVEIVKALEEPSPPSKFYGLYNVHKRLRLCFGKNAGLDLVSGSWGTEVVMRVPVE
jgi:sensor histidine kinase YesM